MDIMGALSALSSAINIGKTAIAARDQNLIDDAVAKMNQKLADVSQSAIALLQEKYQLVEEANDLREKYRKLEASLTDLAGYEPHQTRGGALCLRPKLGLPEAKLSVHVCANCAAAGKKTYLQPIHDGYFLECPAGHPKIPSDKPESGRPSRALTDYDPYDSGP